MTQVARRVLTLRCSKLDLAWDCVSSVVAPTGDIVRSSNVPADLGSAAHAWAEHMQKPDEEQPDPSDLAARYRCGEDELRMLISMMNRMWMQEGSTLRKFFAGCEVEREWEHVEPFPYHGFTHLRIRGKSDMHKITGDLACSNDWKTGHIEAACEHQQRGYAFLMAMAYPELQRFWSAISFVRSGDIYAGEKVYTRDDLLRWKDELVWRLRNSIGTYTTGSHCRHCPRTLECGARDSWMRQAVRDFSSTTEITIDGMPEMVGPQIGEMMRTAKAVEDQCARLKDFAKAYAGRHDGAFPVADGRERRLTTEKRLTIDPRRAWPILAAQLPADALAETMTIGKTKLDKAMRAHGVDPRQVMDQLKEAGAVVESEIVKLPEKKL